MLDSIPYAKLREWMGYYEVEPWGEERADLRAGTICNAVIAPYSKRKKLPRPLSWFPNFAKGPQVKQTTETMRSAFRAFARAAGRTRDEH